MNNNFDQIKKENLELNQKIKKLEVDKIEMKKYYENQLNQVDFKRFLKNNQLYIKKNGYLMYLKSFFVILWRILKAIFRKFKCFFSSKINEITLNKILRKNKNKQIYIFYPGYDWYMKMYQRPQHMAINIANKNNLYFYCTLNINDKINGFKNIENELYVTNEWNMLKKKIHGYNLIVYANMNGCWIDEIKNIINDGNNIFYEYIDDLHEDLTDISPALLERHSYVLKNEKIPILCTSKYLYNKAKNIRSKNLYLSTNGVNYNDFHIINKLSLPEKIKKIVEKNTKIIGYYGALAQWFDYELIVKIANEKKDWDILLIGIDYDKTLEKYNYFHDYSNIHYIGIVPYNELVNYGYYCDVLTIPFLVNEITLATSPVKIFEYMAMEKPIITTDLPECRNYKSVFISKTHSDFIKNIEKGIKIGNSKEYRKILKKEALENTWDKKADEVIKIVGKFNGK
ncbi:MAG: glycosyltransferase [Bacilli bacterium]